MGERKGIATGNFQREHSGCHPRGLEEPQRKKGLNAKIGDLVLNQINNKNDSTQNICLLTLKYSM